jgi:transcriptional regulator with XRE-family HTH domain
MHVAKLDIIGSRGRRDPETLGGRIRRVREREGLSQSDCARWARMTRQQWHAVESGRISNPTWQTMQAIADALNCRIDEFRIR